MGPPDSVHLCVCVYVRVSAGEEGDLRLVGGEVTDDSGFGVVQIFHAGAWGTLCDGDDYRYDYFDGAQYAGLQSFDEVRLHAISPATPAG